MQAPSLNGQPVRNLSSSAIDINGTKNLARDPVDNSVKIPDKSSALNNPYKEKYQKLSQTVKVMFLSIKRRIVKEDPNCVEVLKDSIPLVEDDETIIRKDPLLLVQYIKKISEKSLELKVEEKKKLLEANDKTQSQYEPLLQKLEAEVRKHIQIEQQMKILIENQQERMTELERGVDSEGNIKSTNAVPKEYKKAVAEKDKRILDLEAENAALREQLKTSQTETLQLRAGFNGVSAIVQRLLS